MRASHGKLAALLAAATVGTASFFSVFHVVHAAPACPAPLSQSSSASPAGGSPFIVCSGRIPSFDGTPLDTDLTIPSGATGAVPLVVMLHGWGNSKTEWESTGLNGNGANQYHWNSAWFASQGFAVLTYSSRGFDRSCGQDKSGYSYATDPECAGKASWIHLSDRRWETHDAQYLTGLMVDAGIAQPNKIVVTGDSYGGGQSWLLALSQNQIVDQSSTDANNLILHPWTSPAGVPMSLAAAVPQFPWTDLVSSLMPNGRASDGFFGAPPPGSDSSPLGVEKQSYVDGLYGLGAATGQYAVSGTDSTADLTTWYQAITAGEPYETNPEVAQALTQIGSVFRSPYAVPVPPKSEEIPVFFAQGMTDPLFPAVQGLQEMNKLLAADPGYPVWGVYGDLGHSYADNPPALWQRINSAANTWLQAILSGQSPQNSRVTVVTTDCWGNQSAATYSGGQFQKLSQKAVTFSSPAAQRTVSATAPEPEGVVTDPIANSGCRVINSGTDPDVAAWTFPVSAAGTIIGSPVVNTQITLDGTNSEIAARLWEVNPVTGKQALIGRTVYRLLTGLPGQTFGVAFEISANAWQLACGDQLQLELTQDDSPVWRPDNLTSSITYSGAALTLPITAGNRC